MGETTRIPPAGLGRRRRAVPLAAALLLALGPAMAAREATPEPASAAAAVRVEAAWSGSVGGGANGTVTVRGFDTGAGSVSLALRRLSPSASYPIAIYRGRCPASGAPIVSLGALRTTTGGALSATRPLTTGQRTAVQAAASGTGRLSVKVGAGSAARCGTLAKSLAVTPQIWFAPLDRWPYLPYTGSSDYASLFASGAPWPNVAGRIHVFKFYQPWLREASDAVLRQAVAALKARDIAIAIEVPPLIAPLICGQSVEGFGSGSADTLPIIRRIAALGGTVRFLAMDEPFNGGVLYEGARACRWSAAKVAGQVARFSREIRAAYPSIIVGDIEPWPAVSTADLERWQAAYKAAAGAPLPFLHLDVDWGAAPQDWPTRVREIQRSIKAHGTRFGFIYNGGGEQSDAEWLGHAQDNILAYELDGAGPPDDVIFQSWVDHPDRALPESGPNTFTHLIADYTRTRTTVSLGTPAAAAGRITVGGQVTTLGGQPIARAPVEATAVPRDGPYQVLELTGRVPVGASAGIVGVRVNQEGAGPGTADLTFYELGYSEGGSSANLVPNPRFEQGLNYWGAPGLTLVPSDRGPGSMLRIVATAVEKSGTNSGAFPVTPGAAYRMWVAARVPEASIGSSYVTVMFVDTDRRDIKPLAPDPIPVGSATTDGSGAFSLTTDALEAGRYRLLADFPGTAAYWPARAEAEALVR